MYAYRALNNKKGNRSVQSADLKRISLQVDRRSKQLL